MANKRYEREVELYAFLGELEKSGNQALADFVRKLRESLWQVLDVAITPPGSWQKEVVRPSALADLARGNTFNHCISELEKFIYEHPVLAAALNIQEKLQQVKSPER